MRSAALWSLAIGTFLVAAVPQKTIIITIDGPAPVMDNLDSVSIKASASSASKSTLRASFILSPVETGFPASETGITTNSDSATKSGSATRPAYSKTMESIAIDDESDDGTASVTASGAATSSAILSSTTSILDTTATKTLALASRTTALTRAKQAPASVVLTNTRGLAVDNNSDQNTSTIIEDSASDSNKSNASQNSLQLHNAHYDAMIKAHGILMFIAWAVLCPLGIISARYYKKTSRGEGSWKSVHIGLFVGCMLLTAIAFGLSVAATSEPHFSFTNKGWHPVLGLAMMVLLVLQLAFGSVSLVISHSLFRQAHHWIGRTLFLLGLVTVPLGISLYARDLPIESGVNSWIWITYQVWAVLLFALFGFCEGYMRAYPVPTRDDGPGQTTTTDPGSDADERGIMPRGRDASAATLNAQLDTKSIDTCFKDAIEKDDTSGEFDSIDRAETLDNVAEVLAVRKLCESDVGFDLEGNRGSVIRCGGSEFGTSCVGGDAAVSALNRSQVYSWHGYSDRQSASGLTAHARRFDPIPKERQNYNADDVTQSLNLALSTNIYPVKQQVDRDSYSIVTTVLDNYGDNESSLFEPCKSEQDKPNIKTVTFDNRVERIDIYDVSSSLGPSPVVTLDRSQKAA
ncbi:hypothetical protein BJ741DRAFT_596187 [Chytriomyces cf. hyalinus JEL632]|nr:hypothetical protein BJ741DRAFT_596187 [Chytriomyces cf. hyalinus JEL632]